MELKGGGSMAGISNIIGAYNINPKRVSSKLSFEVGQVFAAKIISSNELNKELILRLIDGWQFPAKLMKPLDFVPEGLIKFQVEGSKDGKLQIKIVSNKKEEDVEKNSIEEFVLENNADVSKKDYEVLEKMIRHNMPLTKENISKIKTILDFKNKIEQDGREEDKFIEKYIKSKGIDVQSDQGKDIEKVLKGFFKELKNISIDDIFTMLENNIELSEDNIKSFLKLSKEDNTIYKELKSITEKLKHTFIHKNTENIYSEILENETVFKESIAASKKETPSVIKVIEESLKNDELTKEEIKVFESLKRLLSETDEGIKTKEYNVLKDTIKDEQDSLSEALGLQTGEVNIEEKLRILEQKLKNSIKSQNQDIETEVKKQLKNKTEEMKSIIQDIIEKISSTKAEAFDKVFETLKEYINNFKVFNSMSSQYYYLDVPVNLNKDEYKCKLLIKDDRKSGKKIDSRNVSLVVSVKTVNIGIVDAYVKVREKNLYIDIKCEEAWVNTLTLGKNKLLEELSGYNYNVYINVNKKEFEANLTNCSEFFGDNSLGSINIRV